MKNDMELPIKHTPLSGPAVDALDTRKEAGTLLDTDAEIRDFMEANKEIVFEQQKQFFEALRKGVAEDRERQKVCSHAGWSFDKYGRCCFICGAFMVDFGD